MTRAQSEPLPAASFVAAGATAGCSAAAFCAAPACGVSASAAPAAGAAPSEPSGTVSVRRMSSGGMQVWSSQIIHSMSTATVAVSAVSRTRWAKRALPVKVPICMPKVVSKWVSGVVSCSTEPSSAAPSAVKRNVVALGPPS